MFITDLGLKESKEQREEQAGRLFLSALDSECGVTSLSQVPAIRTESLNYKPNKHFYLHPHIAVGHSILL